MRSRLVSILSPIPEAQEDTGSCELFFREDTQASQSRELMGDVGSGLDEKFIGRSDYCEGCHCHTFRSALANAQLGAPTRKILLRPVKA